MSSGNNKPMIEGLTSPAASAVNMRKENSTASLNLDVLRSVRMRPKLAAGVAAAVFLLIVGFALSRKPTYMAYSLTYVEPMTSKVLSDGTGGGFDPARYDSYLQQQMQTALRPDILASAIRKLPPGIWQYPGEKEQSAVARLQKSLKVERVTTSYQLSISLSGPDPDAVAATVNAVTNAYLDQGRKDEHAISSQRLQLLTQERQRIQSDLEQDRVEQAGLSGALGVASPVGELANPYDTQLTGVRTQLAAARAAHDVALAQLASVKRTAGAQTPGLAAAADDLLQGDTGLSSMKTTINQRKAVLSSQMAGLTPSNPVYKQDQDEIADLDRSLDKMTADLREKAEHRVEDKLGLELQRTASVEGMLNSQLAHQTATATGAAPKIQRAAELASDITRLTARFGTVDDAIRGLELEANGPGMAHLSVAAAVPLSPQPSKRKLFLLLSLPLALLMGAGAAVIAHRRDPLVYIESDLQQVLGFPPIGVLPSRDEVSRATVEEYVFRIAAGVETAYRVSSARSFVFTAVSPTVVVTGLIAILQSKLEELGFSVHVLQANALLQPGLGGGTATPTPRQRELPGSGYLALLHDPNHEGFAAANLHELKKNHDLLLIDAPPLLHSAATEYAVRCADATILVAGSAVTQRVELTQAAILLDRLNVAGVGAVLKDLLLKHADPSFKKAIEVLESRWSAEALEASRASRAARAAYHTTRTPHTSQDKADKPVTADTPDRQISDTPVEASHPAQMEDDDRRDSSINAKDEPVQRADEWDGRMADTIMEASTSNATHEHEAHEPHEDEHVEMEQPVNPHPQSFGPMSVAQPLVAHELPEAMLESEVATSSVSAPEPLVEKPEPLAEAPAPAFTPSPRAEGSAELTEEEQEIETSDRAKMWLQRLLNPGSVPEPVITRRPVVDDIEEEELHPAEKHLAEAETISSEHVPSIIHHDEAELAAAAEVHVAEPHQAELELEHFHPPAAEVPEPTIEHVAPVLEPEPVVETHARSEHQEAVAAALETKHSAEETPAVVEEAPTIVEEEPAPVHADEAWEATPVHARYPVSANFGAAAQDFHETHQHVHSTAEMEVEHLIPDAVDTPEEHPPVEDPATHELHHELHSMLDHDVPVAEDVPITEVEHDVQVEAAMSPVADVVPAAHVPELSAAQHHHADQDENMPVSPAYEATASVEHPEEIADSEPVPATQEASADVPQVPEEVIEPEPLVTPAPWEKGRTARLEQAARLAGPPRAAQPASDPHLPLRATFSGVRRAAALREGRDPAVAAPTRLAGRIEGSIEPETGRMTRSWGMLSRFGATSGSEDAATESLEDQGGQ